MMNMMTEQSHSKRSMTPAIFKGLIIGACLLAASYLAYRLWFLRIVPRNVPHDPNVMVSPAMGEVIAVKPFNKVMLIEHKDGVEAGAIQMWTNDVAASGTVISIKLSLSDVHYQRAPIDSRVVSINHVNGSFNNAVVLDSDDSVVRYENEHNEILLQSAGGFKYKVIQIAGFVARRIEDAVTAGQNVCQGDILGVIKMGSQVVIIVPGQIKVMVKAGDRLIDGETVIGKLPV